MAKKKLELIEEVYGWGFTFEMVNNFMSSATENDTVVIPINSYGGSVMEGIAIHNVIKGSKAKTEAHIVGYAASMGTIISASADVVVMPENGYYMIHDASALTYGGTIEHESTASLLEKINDDMAGIYSEKTGISKEDVRAMMSKTTWLTAKDAKEMGFVDRLSEGSEIHASAQMLDYANVPEDLVASASQAEAQQATMWKKVLQLLTNINQKFMSKETTSANEELTKAQEELAAAQAKVDALSKTTATEKEGVTLESLADTVQALSTKVSKSEEKVTQLSTENEQLKAAITEKDATIAQLGKKPKAEIEELDSEDSGSPEGNTWDNDPINLKAKAIRESMGK